jgi:hypothetical protein
MNSWIILDRRERHLKRKSSWEAEEDTQKIFGQGKREEGERQAAGIRHDRRLFLERHLGEELGAAEESIEWKLEVKWWGARKREARLYGLSGEWLGV